MRPPTTRLAAALAAVALTVTACSDGGDPPPPDDAGTDAATATPDEAAADDGTRGEVMDAVASTESTLLYAYRSTRSDDDAEATGPFLVDAASGRARLVVNRDDEMVEVLIADDASYARRLGDDGKAAEDATWTQVDPERWFGVSADGAVALLRALLGDATAGDGEHVAVEGEAGTRPEVVVEYETGDDGVPTLIRVVQTQVRDGDEQGPRAVTELRLEDRDATLNWPDDAPA